MDADTTIPVIFYKLAMYISLIILTSFISSLETHISKFKSISNSESEYEYNPLIEKIAIKSEKYILSMKFTKIFIALIFSIYMVQNKNNLIYSIVQENSSIGYDINIFLNVLSISFVLITLGSTIPNKLALFNDKQVSGFTLFMINIIYIITFPVVEIINSFNNIILSLMHKNADDFDEKVSAEEIKALVETASEKGVFNDIEKEMINSIISFDNITAKDIMVSRKDTYKIDITQPLESYLDEIIETYYSRIPVYRENIDDIIGILNTKDLLVQARKVGFENINIEELLQKPYFVPEMKSIDELFKEMQRLRNHMAILVDEYGGFSGIVTIEDLIEQIMGDINDEFDDEEMSISKISDTEYIIDGTTEIREINKELELNLENENYDTLSGLLVEKLGYIPSEEEKPVVCIDNLNFKVELASENRIQKVILTINPIENDEIE